MVKERMCLLMLLTDRIEIICVYKGSSIEFPNFKIKGVIL